MLILTNILLAKSALSLSSIGVYEALIFIGTGVSFFWVSGFARGVLTLYPTLDEKAQQVFFFNVFVLFSGLSCVIGLSFLYFEQAIITALTDYETLPYFPLLCIYLCINTPTYLVEYIYLLNNKPRQIVGFGLFAFGLHVLVVTVPIFLGFSLQESFYGLIGLAILKWLWLVGLLFRYGRLGVNWGLLKSFTVLSLPLILNMVVTGSADYIDGFILLQYFDEDTFAIFRYGAREFPLTLALTTAFSAALIPQIAQNQAAGLATIRQKSMRLMHILFGSSIVLMLTSPILFPLVFREGFQESAVIFNLYLLILISRVVFPQTILIGYQKTGIIFYFSIIELGINVGLSLLLLNTMGWLGIAIATVIAYITYKLMLTIYVHFRLGIRVQEYLNLRWYSLYSGLLLVSFVVSWLVFYEK